MPPRSARPSPEMIPEEPDEEEPEEGEEEFDFEDEGMDLGAVLEPFLATEDGQTICTALVAISKHMENQNKILIKILTQLTKQ